MRIYALKQAVYEATVTDRLRPSVGDEYKDRKGHRWRVRSIQEYRGIELVDPPAPKPLWLVTVTAEHYAYRLEPGEELVGLDTKRENPGDEALWDGNVIGAPGDRKGFGRLLRHKNNETESWIYRETAAEFELCVGPRVAGYNHFANPVFQLKTPLDDLDAWDRIRGILSELIRVEDGKG